MACKLRFADSGNLGTVGTDSGHGGGAEGARRFRLSDFLLSAGMAGIGRLFSHSGEKIDILY